MQYGARYNETSDLVDLVSKIIDMTFIPIDSDTWGRTYSIPLPEDKEFYRLVDIRGSVAWDWEDKECYYTGPQGTLFMQFLSVHESATELQRKIDAAIATGELEAEAMPMEEENENVE